MFLQDRPHPVRDEPRSARLVSPFFVVVGMVFVVMRVVGVWGAQIVLYKDSATYRPPPGGLLYPLVSFTGDAPRSFVVPAFYAVFPDDTSRVVAQVIVSIVAWLALAMVLASLLRTAAAQRCAFVAVLLLGLSTQVVTWDAAILSESLTISLTVLSVAAWLWFVDRPTWISAGLVVVFTGSWVLLRPFQYPVALGLAAVCLVWAWRRSARRDLKLAVAGCLALVALMSFVISPRINDGYRNRDGYGVSYFTEAFGQNFFKRYLADPEAEAWFREQGMPDWQGMSAPSRSPGQAVNDYADWHVFFAEIRQRPDWQKWLDEDAQSAILRYTLSHPGTVVDQFVDHVPLMLRSPWTDEYGADIDLLPPPLGWVYFSGSSTSWWWGDWVAWAIVVSVLAVMVVVRGRQPRAGLLVVGGVIVVLSAGLAFQVWLGSAYEFVRHAVPSTHLLRIGLVILAAVLLDALLARELPQGRSRAPVASRNQPTPASRSMS